MQSTNKDALIENYVVRKDSKTWQPLVEQGLSYPGIAVISLRFDAATKRSPSILLKFDPGAAYPFHNHPAGEEIYVISGEAILEGMTLFAGDYLYTPPGFKHSVQTVSGCTLLFIVPEEVEIL